MSPDEIKPEAKKTTTRPCPHCKQPMEITTGLRNWKNLFKMPTMEDWITLAIMVMVIAAYFAYQHDTKTCRETLSNLDLICTMYNEQQLQKTTASVSDYERLNLSDFNLSKIIEGNG